MVNWNDSDVANIDFEVQAKTGDNSYGLPCLGNSKNCSYLYNH